MTDIQIQKMISKGRLILTMRRFLVHYSASIFFSLSSLILIATLIIHWSKNASQKNFFIVVLMIFVLFPLLAIITFINQYKNLKFHSFQTQFSKTDNHKLAAQTLRRIGWKIKVNQKEFIEAYNPKWSNGRTWGYEMMSIIISEKEILINCICSVDTIWFQAGLTFGKLKNLVTDFKNRFNIASKQVLDERNAKML
jgi:hypothetical protein